MCFLKGRKQELIWNRFVNVHGLPGKNIPADLHQEHLNRMCKIALQGLCANKTEKAITRIGKAQGTLSLVLDKFDEENCTLASSGVHKKLTAEKDRDTIIKQLQQAHVFDYCNSHRKHSMDQRTCIIIIINVLYYYYYVNCFLVIIYFNCMLYD